MILDCTYNYVKVIILVENLRSFERKHDPWSILIVFEIPSALQQSVKNMIVEDVDVHFTLLVERNLENLSMQNNKYV